VNMKSYLQLWAGAMPSRGVGGNGQRDVATAGVGGGGSARQAKPVLDRRNLGWSCLLQR